MHSIVKSDEMLMHKGKNCAESRCALKGESRCWPSLRENALDGKIVKKRRTQEKLFRVN